MREGLCVWSDEVGELRIDECVLHVERMEDDRILKRVYVGECVVVVQRISRGRDGLIP